MLVQHILQLKCLFRSNLVYLICLGKALRSIKLNLTPIPKLMIPRSSQLSWLQRVPELLLEGLRNWLDRLLVAYRKRLSLPPQKRDWADLWAKRFSEIDRLDPSQARPLPPEYDRLVEKYRRQGLDL